MIEGMSALDTFGLIFLDDSKSGLHHAPITHVALNSSSKHEYSDAPVLTPQCITFRELEYQIDRLKDELDEIKAQAKRRFASDSRRQTNRAEAAKVLAPQV
jgi:hypothetical protein